MNKPLCFVLMPFGKKRHETGKTTPLKYTAWFLALTAVAPVIWLCVSFSELVAAKPVTPGGAGKWILGLIVTFIATYFSDGWSGSRAGATVYIALYSAL